MVAPAVDVPNEKDGVLEVFPPKRPPEGAPEVVVAWPGAALELGVPKDMLTAERLPAWVV